MLLLRHVLFIYGRMMSLKNLPCLTLGPHATASDRVQPASDRVQPEKTSPAMAEKRKEKTKTADETKPIRIEIPKNAERHTTKENIQLFFGCSQAVKPTSESEATANSAANLEPISISSSPLAKATSSENIIQPAQASENVQPSRSSGEKAVAGLLPKVAVQAKKDILGHSVVVRSMIARARLRLLGRPARRITSKRTLKECELKPEETKVTEDPKEKVVPHLPWPAVPTCTGSMPSSVSFEDASFLQLQCEFS
jgi:hypothetical protein